jgi:YbbR domain-containing protein
VSIPPFSVGTTSAIVVTGTKINQSLNSEMALQVTDVAGNVTNCDPVLINALGTTKSVSVNVPTAEHFVTVYNGNPGISSVTMKVNGKQFVMTNLKASETRNLDISAALLAGDQNTITLTAAGSATGTAIVQIWDGV